MNLEFLQQAEQLWLFIESSGSNLNLCGAATESDFLEVETALDLQLPDEMKAIYTFHNGQVWSVGANCFIKNLSLLNTKAIIEVWNFLNAEFDGEDLQVEADENIKPVLWNSRWVPVAENGGGDYVCLDTDPTHEGAIGQVLYFYHDWGKRTVLAKNLFDFIKICLEEKPL